jgi:hypothetical protein
VKRRAAFARCASAPRAVSLANAAFVAFISVTAVVAVTTVNAAQGGGKPATGNPTPGTAQPDPPKVADRVTFVGCLQRVARGAGAATAAEANIPSNLRFELTNAEPAQRVPPGTASPADGQTSSASSKVYRVEGIDSVFSPFIGSKVEITGEVRPPPKAEKGAPPTLVVEFLQRIAAKCS